MVIALLKRMTEYAEYVPSYVLKLQLYGIFIRNFEHIKHISFVFYLLNLNKSSRQIKYTNLLILLLTAILLLPVLGLLIRYGSIFKLSHSFWITLHEFRYTLFAIRFATLFEETYIPMIVSSYNLSVKGSFEVYFSN